MPINLIDKAHPPAVGAGTIIDLRIWISQKGISSAERGQRESLALDLIKVLASTKAEENLQPVNLDLKSHQPRRGRIKDLKSVDPKMRLTFPVELKISNYDLITSLPRGLNCSSGLQLRMKSLAETPESLMVKDLVMIDCVKLRSFSGNLSITGDVTIDKVDVEFKLPSSLQLPGSLRMANFSKGIVFPQKLEIGKDLALEHMHGETKLSKWLQMGGDVAISKCRGKVQFPELKLSAEGRIALSDCSDEVTFPGRIVNFKTFSIDRSRGLVEFPEKIDVNKSFVVGGEAVRLEAHGFVADNLTLISYPKLQRIPGPLYVNNLTMDSCKSIENLPKIVSRDAINMRHCANLKSFAPGSAFTNVDLIGLAKLEVLPAFGPGLRDIRAVDCAALHDLSVLTRELYPRGGLTLALKRCGALVALHEAMPQMQEISITFCGRLRRLAEQLSVTEALTVENCPSLEALPARLYCEGELTVINCPNLTRVPARPFYAHHVVLQNLPALTSVSSDLLTYMPDAPPRGFRQIQLWNTGLPRTAVENLAATQVANLDFNGTSQLLAPMDPKISREREVRNFNYLAAATYDGPETRNSELTCPITLNTLAEIEQPIFYRLGGKAWVMVDAPSFFMHYVNTGEESIARQPIDLRDLFRPLTRLSPKRPHEPEAETNPAAKRARRGPEQS